jgi:hypothetical protein
LCYQCGPASTDPTQQLCGGACVSTTTDTGNCGACGNGCASGQSCVAGACVTPCSDGQTACGTICVDLQTDAAHCGACDTQCAFAHASATCAAGVCTLGVCDAGYGNCDGNESTGCETDVTSSVDHCGACGSGCAAVANATVSCVNGSCAYACEPGFTDCGGACVDLQTDANHCGACDTLCPEGASCSAGTCACPSSTPTVCTYYPDGYNPREHCVDTQGDDNSNCGGCGYTCGSIDGVQEICRDGGCRAPAGVTCYAVTGVEDFCYSGQCVNPDGSTCTNPYYGGGCVCA